MSFQVKKFSAKISLREAWNGLTCWCIHSTCINKYKTIFWYYLAYSHHKTNMTTNNPLHAFPYTNRNEASSPSGRQFHPRTESTSSRAAAIGAPSNIININRDTVGVSLNRRSSDSDLSITPKGKQLFLLLYILSFFDSQFLFILLLNF